MKIPALALLVLFVEAKFCFAAAPWSGIIGFLQMVARVQDEPDNACCVYDENYVNDTAPLRRIVYAVEEQVLPGEMPDTENGPRVVFDSALALTKEPDGSAMAANSTETASYSHRKDDDDSPSSRERRSPEAHEVKIQANGAEAAVTTKGQNETVQGNLTDVQSGRNAPHGHHHHHHFLGRKLWYVPLWFSVYYILYLTALVVKSVAQHRIKYPTLVPEGELGVNRRRGGAGRYHPSKLDGRSQTRRIYGAIDGAERKYRRQ